MQTRTQISHRDGLPLVRLGQGDSARDIYPSDFQPKREPRPDVVADPNRVLAIDAIREAVIESLHLDVEDLSFDHEFGTRREYALVSRRRTITIDYRPWLDAMATMIDEESSLPFQFIDVQASRDFEGCDLYGRWRLTLNRQQTAVIWMRYPDRCICLYDVTEQEER